MIDGVLDDAAWDDAAVISDFVQARPIDQGTPTERSEIYLMYDENALYIGGRFWDSEPEQISANILKQKTGLANDDRLAVIIDPFNQRRGGYRFELNPNGVRVDAIYQSNSSFQTNWEAIWEGTATIDDEGWSTEMAIPFKTLSFDPDNDTWAMNFGRAIRRKNEEAAWVSRNRTINPSIVGLVTGFSGMNQGIGLDVAPSVSTVRTRSFSPSGSDTEIEPSLDLFYKLTPSLNATLTLNTDFAATEVDDRQVNLTRFSLFFPERRAFFLQDNDLFEFGNIGSRESTAADRATLENGRPFFSRRLGLSPSGEPVDLEYGGKISGRVGRWTIGTLAVRQDEHEDVPASNAFVGRATANVLAESSVGVIVTDGDPSSGADNSLYGFDFRYLNTRLPGGRTISGEAWYQRSDTEGVDGDDGAYGLGFSMPNSEGWRGGASIRQLEANFDPALGFVSRRGVRARNVELGYTRFTDGGFVQQVFAGVDAQRIDRLSGDLQSQRISWTPLQLQSRARDVFQLRYLADKENVLEPFELYRDPTRTVGVAPGLYSFKRYGFDLETGAQRKLSGNFTYRTGDFYDGERLQVEAGLGWRPSKHYFLNVGYEWNDIDLRAGDFISRLVELTNGVVFSSKLSWVTLVQYDDISETLGINSRLHWIPREGREGFIVLNHNLQDFDKDNSFESMASELTLKFDYTFRF
ncbi:MAG TPA: DUF5916 domain-containing protein [Gammaproteobacteria bacterium]